MDADQASPFPAVVAHAAGLCAEMAAKFGLAPDDAGVRAFIDKLRGAGIRFLAEPGGSKLLATVIADVAP